MEQSEEKEDREEYRGKFMLTGNESKNDGEEIILKNNSRNHKPVML